MHVVLFDSKLVQDFVVFRTQTFALVDHFAVVASLSRVSIFLISIGYLLSVESLRRLLICFRLF